MFTNDSNGPDCWKCSLNVEWHDCSWCPVIQLRRGIHHRNGTPAKPLPAAAILPYSARCKNLFKPMKINLLSARRTRTGFTIVELLVVIAIIAILAAMLLPVLAAATKAAKKTKAKTEIQAFVQAIEAYDQAYGRFPITTDEKNAAYAGGNNDFTTGYVPYPQDPNRTPAKTWPSTGGGWFNNTGYSFDNNSNVVAILMDVTAYSSGALTMNTNHIYNPKQIKFLNAKISGYDPASQDANPPGGVDITGVYRDPWGNPYIISMDTSYDDQCSDIMYRRDLVTGPAGANTNPGLNGLANPDTTKNNNFQFHGKVMIWSAGPDGQIDPTKAGNQDVNKDNILSWQ